MYLLALASPFNLTDVVFGAAYANVNCQLAFVTNSSMLFLLLLVLLLLLLLLLLVPLLPRLLVYLVHTAIN